MGFRAERVHFWLIVHPSGHPINRSHSVGVRRRTDCPAILSDDAEVSLKELLHSIWESVDSCWECANDSRAVSNAAGNTLLLRLARISRI